MRPNYAFKRTAEQALRSTQTVAPQPLNAALGVIGGFLSNSAARKKMLEPLVDNAFDFLSMSIRQLQKAPKHSVINFQAAIELVLKARLLAEHWSLVVSPKTTPDWDAFVAGNFQSVTLHEAAERLDKVLKTGLSREQLKAFQAVASHRNRMVHFFHEASTPTANTQQIQGIVKEQLRAWFFLHELMVKQWHEIFSPWARKISKMEVRLRAHHEFLEIIFDELSGKIRELKSAGTWFALCPVCGLEAVGHPPQMHVLYESRCLVCDFEESCIQIACPGCGEEGSVFRAGQDAECKKCSATYGNQALLSIFVDEGAAYEAIREGDTYPFPANCGYCSSFEVVVPLPSGKLLCTECFDVTDELRSCEWCNDESTHLVEDSFWSGCEFCDGRAGWERD